MLVAHRVFVLLYSEKFTNVKNKLHNAAGKLCVKIFPHISKLQLFNCCNFGFHAFELRIFNIIKIENKCEL